MQKAVISHYQARRALDTRLRGMEIAEISLDLGLTTTRLIVTQNGLQLPDGMVLEWEVLEEISDAISSCFVIEADGARPIQFFSELTERAYSLYPTQGAPTMLISGIPMHRIKGTEPHADTLEKIRTIKPVVGRVLDTATGLGYTAIEAVWTAEHVTTIEIDPASLEVCKLNPWSQKLFDNPRITQVIGDSFEVVSDMGSGSFTRVIHDPPAFSLSGDLYSSDFYHELYRVMRNHSRLFHYIGDPESRSGRSITAGVIRRLEQAGFQNVRRAPKAFGVVAVR
jgi:predicted methyltransferase